MSMSLQLVQKTSRIVERKINRDYFNDTTQSLTHKELWLNRLWFGILLVVSTFVAYGLIP